MKCNIICCLSCLVLLACNHQSVFYSRPQDKQKAMKVAGLFYQQIRDQNFSNALDYVGEEMRRQQDTSQILQIFVTVHNRLGNLEKVELRNWKVEVTNNRLEPNSYYLEFNNVYELGEAKETMILTMEKAGELKMFYYNVNSDKFLDPI